MHASIPQTGINAFEQEAKFGLEVCQFLHKKYSKITKPFYTRSTFVMTKHEKNVDSINIIPGKEIFYLNCRIMPSYNLSQILSDIKKISEKYKAKIEIEIVQREDAPKPTDGNAPIVKLLKSTLKKRLGVNGMLMGIGGGTIAAYLRKAGYDAVVWAIEDDIAHQPNEYARLANIYKIISVFYDIVT